MLIRETIWVKEFREKIEGKHGLNAGEVEYVLEHKPLIRFLERGAAKASICTPPGVARRTAGTW